MAGNSFAFNLAGFGSMLGYFNDLNDTLEDEVAYWVGTTVEYAAAVELGAEGRTPLPYLGPAVQSVNADKVAEQLNKVLSGDEVELVKTLALEVERRAKANAPVDTGNLRASIQAGPSISSMEGRSEANKIL